MNTTANTFKCTNCGRDGLTDENPWHDCYEAAQAEKIEKFNELLDLEADMLRAKGTTVVGIDADTRDRAKNDFTKFMAEWSEKFEVLGSEDIQREYGAFRAANTLTVPVLV